MMASGNMMSWISDELKNVNKAIKKGGVEISMDFYPLVLFKYSLSFSREMYHVITMPTFDTDIKQWKL